VLRVCVAPNNKLHFLFFPFFGTGVVERVFRMSEVHIDHGVNPFA
jgi:hypothetical protein